MSLNHPISGSHPHSEEENGLVYHFSSHQPLRLPRQLNHHTIDDHHLWIEPEEGRLIVLTGEENTLFEGLHAGVPPAKLFSRWFQEKIRGGAPGDISSQWLRLVDLVTRLAGAGLVEGIEGYHDVRQQQPEKFARLHLTGRCQLRCLHCYASSSPEADSSGELPTERWLRLIDDLANHGGASVLFTGGEPLLRPDCPGLIQHAHNRGLETVLFTNGLLVEKYLPQLNGFVSLIQVSLNGPDEASNDPIRGPGTFRRVLKAIDLLLEAGMPVRLGMTVMEKNWFAIKTGFRAFARRFAGSPLKFHLGYGVCNYGRATFLDDRLDLEEAREILDELMAEANQDQDRRITRKTTSCGYCEQLVVAPDGMVYPCHLLHGALGPIDRQPLPQWHDSLRTLAREHMVDKVEDCCACDLRNLCGGTCRVINEQTTGSKFKTTCTTEGRTVRYRNLTRLFKPAAPPKTQERR